MNEKQLLISLKEGDHKAFTALYNQYWKQVYNFCRLYVQEDLAEEVMQEVFVKLWTIRASIHEEDNFKGYLFIITRNIIFNQNRRSVYDAALKTTLMTAVEESCDFEDEISANDLQECIERLIGEMPPQRQLIFNLSRKKYLSYREIAEKLNVSEKAVEQSIGRSLKYLKEHLSIMHIPFLLLSSFFEK
ncbi:MAG: RNA polymerase sigma-70 factor [Bacteroides sp.]